jgi:WXG100 family type VII secretion target
MKRLDVDSDVVLRTAHGASSDAVELGDELSRLAREWQDVSHGWTGSAATAFAALWDEWHDGATKVVQIVTESSEDLAQAAVLYAQQDAESAHALESASVAAPAPLAVEMGL